MNYKINKIAENNVEIVYTKNVTDINGAVFEVMAEDEPVSFGKQEVERQLLDIEKQILYWQNFNEKTYKKDMQDEMQKRKNILLEVQKALKE